MKAFSRTIHGAAALSLVSCMSLKAGAPVHYGFSVQLNAPVSELKSDINGKVGGGASFQVSIETSGRTILRPRLDVDVFPVSERDRPNSTYRDRVDLASVGIGTDFLYSFSGRNNQGLYGLGGVGMQRWTQVRSSRNTSGHGGWSDDDSSNSRGSLWLAAGLGYQINRIVGLEGRVVGSKYSGILAESPGTRTAVVTQLAVACRW